MAYLLELYGEFVIRFTNPPLLEEYNSSDPIQDKLDQGK
jgi:hypothetical protein